MRPAIPVKVSRAVHVIEDWLPSDGRTDMDPQVVAHRLVAPKKFEMTSVGRLNKAPLRPGEILVDRYFSTICGTDIPNWNGREFNSYPGPPGFPMHECVGKVVASASAAYRKGDRVVAIPLDDTGLASYFVSTETRCARVPRHLSDVASCISQPLATIMFALDRVGTVHNKDAVILGFGSIGHLFAMLLRLRGCKTITVVDAAMRHDHIEWGADALVHRNIQNVSLDTASELEADLVVDAIGHDARTLIAATQYARPGGTVVIFGLPHAESALNMSEVFYKNISLLPSVNPPWPEYLSRAATIAQVMPELLSRLVTDVFGFDDAQEAYALYDRDSIQRIKVGIRRRE
jgi:L-iditol 2-dehydrogenase